MNTKKINFLRLGAIYSTELIEKLYNLLKQLRPNVTYNEFIDLYQIMEKTTQYDGFVLTKDDKVLGFISFEILTRFSLRGKFLYIADFVIDENYRGQKYGQTLMQKVEDIAKAEGCHTIVLESGLQRHDAHRFYKKLNYESASYSFRKTL